MHILKSYNVHARIVDDINESVDIIEAIKIFKDITSLCDFWNVFQKQKGEELIPSNTWEDILDFNNLLRAFNFTEIDKKLLHDLLDSVIYKNKRKFAGQFTTPVELAKLLIRVTVRDKRLMTIDPCCGTGTIAKEIYNFKKESIGVERSMETVWASDKFSLPLQMATFNLADPEALGVCN